MDDLKVASTEKERLLLIKSLEDVFGTCSKKLGTFMYLGVQHEQSKDKRTIYKHQRHYVEELHRITIGAQLAQKCQDIEADLDESEISFTRSLLGAPAWWTHTRPEIQVFVGFVQRNVKKLQVLHAVLLNTCLSVYRSIRAASWWCIFRAVRRSTVLLIQPSVQRNRTVLLSEQT